MSEDSTPVQWTSLRVIVTIPERADVSNAGQISDELLAVIDCGAAELIADMSATASCDYAGAEALVGAYSRAAASGTQLRLVVVSQTVRRVLAVHGLDRLMPIHSRLEAAVLARARGREVQAEPRSGAITVAVAAGLPLAVDPVDRVSELLDWVVNRIIGAGVSLQAAVDLPGDASEMRIAEALERLEDVVREVRQHVFAEHAHKAQPGFAGRAPLDVRERSAQTADRAAWLQERMVQAAHALQLTAADTAALLERQANLSGQPARIDFPTEIKRWQAVADQAKQIAKRWERQP